MILTLAGISGLALVVALGCMFKKVLKKFIPWLMLIAGIGLAGVLGTLVDRIVGRAVNGVSNATSKLLGAGVGGMALIALLTVLIVPHMKPKGQPPTRFTPWIALLYPAVLVAVGGVFSQAAGLGSNIVTDGANTVGAFFASLVAG
jgi:hypothetical protein